MAVQSPAAEPQEKLGLNIGGRQKRRTKNEGDERPFKCNKCERTYLSYAALYTHKKIKHSTINADDFSTASCIPPTLSSSGSTMHALSQSTLPPPAPAPAPISFFTPEKVGGPTPISWGFEEAYNILYGTSKKYGSYQLHPLYLQLSKLEHSSAPKDCYRDKGNAESSVDVKQLSVAVRSQQMQPSDKDKLPLRNTLSDTANNDNHAHALDIKSNADCNAVKVGKKCDEVFAEYLGSVAVCLKPESYKQVVRLAFLFRECLNQHGHKLQSSCEVASGPLPGLTINNEEYCLVHTAESAPEISNEFITTYLEQLSGSFVRTEAIALTHHLCLWLYSKGYTSSKLSFASPTPTIANP